MGCDYANRMVSRRQPNRSIIGSGVDLSEPPTLVPAMPEFATYDVPAWITTAPSARRTGRRIPKSVRGGRHNGGEPLGLVHLGRFAQQYRQLFGESPSQTLRANNQR